MSKRRENEQKPLEILKVGSYLVLLGIFIGATLGVYTLFNPPLFVILISISQYEAVLFFLGVYLPSFVVIVALGYLFASMPKLEKPTLRYTIGLSALILLCLALSALSIFNFLSLLGGILILTAVILAYTKPTFKALWKREACFFVDTGAILVASSSMLLLLMWIISRFLQTYSIGVYKSGFSYPFILLVTGILSLLTFYLTPLLCLHELNIGLCGILGLTTSVLSFVTIMQGQPVYFNLSAYLGVFQAGVGTILTLCGALIYIKLSIFGTTSPPPFQEPSFLYQGRYCPYCGEPWMNPNQKFCSVCGRNLRWRLRTSFCPYCGRLVSEDFRNCPHCKEDILSLPIYVSLEKREEIELAKSGKLGMLRTVLETFPEHTNVALKEFIYICILTFVFAFMAFIGHVKTEPASVILVVSRYGFPLEWLEVLLSVSWVHDVRIVWTALILDFALYFLLAFAIVYGATKLKS